MKRVSKKIQGIYKAVLLCFSVIEHTQFFIQNTLDIEVISSQKPVEKLALQAEHTRPSPSLLQCEQKGTLGAREAKPEQSGGKGGKCESDSVIFVICFFKV